MKHIRKFEKFNYYDIDDYCEKYNIKDYTINDDNSIDVNGDVDLSTFSRHKIKLTEIPIKFNRVNGMFNCHNNELTSLENSPRYIGGQFHCGENKLKTLFGGPNNVNGNYLCNNNNLKDVYGFPKFHNNNLFIHSNPVNEILNLIPISLFDKVMIRFIRLLNEYKVIRNGDTIVESRLKDVLDDLSLSNNIKKSNMENLEKIDFKNYRVI